MLRCVSAAAVVGLITLVNVVWWQLGFDNGCVVIKMGGDMPVASMDQSGKIIWANGNEVQSVNIKQGADDAADGERLMLSNKELGTCEGYIASLNHNTNGRFVAVCGDGEYTIYTALAWRNKAYGQAVSFAWSFDGEFATLQGNGKVKLYNKNFKERLQTHTAVSLYLPVAHCISVIYGMNVTTEQWA